MKQGIEHILKLKVSACVKFLVSYLLSHYIDETRLGRREGQREKKWE